VSPRGAIGVYVARQVLHTEADAEHGEPVQPLERLADRSKGAAGLSPHFSQRAGHMPECGILLGT